MKRILSGIIALLILFSGIPVVSAQGYSLKIVNTFTNDMMGGKSYSTGYSPIVVGDMVRIVLPLESTNISGITVTPSAESPFILSNLQQTLPYSFYMGSNGTGFGGYLVDFIIQLEKERKNGRYSVALEAEYKDEEGNSQKQTFNVFVLITDGVNETPKPTDPKLELDADNTYNGMNASYSNGYVPEEQGENVRILMPIVTSDEFKNNTISVSSVFDQAEVFKPSNILKSVIKTSHTTSGGTKDAFLIDMTLPLAEKRKNGVYLLQLKVKGETQAGTAVESTFSVYVTITKGKDPNDPEEPDGTAGLVIDGERRYPGMENAYNDGYVPEVVGDNVRVILPLKSTGKIKDTKITVAPALNAAPFVTKNYQTTVEQEKHLTNAGSQEAYLIDLMLELRKDRANGTFPLSIKVTFTDEKNVVHTVDFSVNILITDAQPGPGERTLVIDANARYPGMEQSYSQGYSPKVADNKVRIVLPLIANGDVKDNSMTVIPSFTGAPFISKNYQNTVFGLEHQTDVGMRNAYLVDITLDLMEKRANGTYAVTMKMSYTDSQNKTYTQDIAINVIITDGTNSDDPAITSGILYIDNKHRYAGMNAAYQNGYIPEVSGDKVTIILPLLEKVPILDGKLVVTPGLGDGAASPFVIKHYEKDFIKGIHKDSIGNEIDGYLVKFTFNLKSKRNIGTYPVNLVLKYRTQDQTEREQTFTFTVTIKKGIDPNATKPPEPTPKPESQAKLMISRFKVSASPVMAGEEFTLAVAFKNTSKDKSLKNIRAVVSSDGPDIKIENPNHYFDGLGRLGELVINLKLSTRNDSTAAPHKISFALDFEDEKGSALTLTDGVTIDVRQPVRVSMEAPTLPSKVNAGDTLPIPVSIMNLGRTTIYNVRCTLDAPGLIANGPNFVGNMNTGTASNTKMSVFIGTKTMSGTEDPENPEDKYGYTYGKMTLVYEDEFGKEYTEDFDIYTEIAAPVIQTGGNKPEEKPVEMAGQWWITIAVAGVLAAGAVVFIILRKKKRINEQD